MNNLNNIIYKNTEVPIIETSIMIETPLEQIVDRALPQESLSTTLQDRAIKELTFSLFKPNQKTDDEISLLESKDEVEKALKRVLPLVTDDTTIIIKANAVKGRDLITSDGSISLDNLAGLFIKQFSKNSPNKLKIRFQVPDAGTPQQTNHTSFASSFWAKLYANGIDSEVIAPNKKIEMKTKWEGDAIKITPALTKPKYTYQVQFSLQPAVGQTLGWKAFYRGIDSSTIYLPDVGVNQISIKLAPLKKLDHDSRLYIVGHGSPGCESIFSDNNGKQASPETIAILLSIFASQLKKLDDGKRIKISLVVCNGATKTDKKESFALQLSQALDRKGIPAEVVGRHGIVATYHDDLKKTVDDKYHENGSKSSFVTINGITTITPIKYK